MHLSPAMIERLLQVAQEARAAGHGAKGAIYAAACDELGISQSTLHRALRSLTVLPGRKQRRDAGQRCLSLEEAKVISAYLIESYRKNNTKRLASIEQALAVLRANEMVRAVRRDPRSGAVAPLSCSAVGRALRAYGMHPDQLLQPTPAVQLRSLHPNHVWQIDASLCVLFYLRSDDAPEQGLQVMDARRFYKNKPHNLKAIESDRVWSYEITDHASGVIFVHYVLGAESATNLAEAFIEAIQQRPNDPFHGVPFVVMVDQGSANTSALFRNLARRLRIELLPHAPGNARATGQVEQARNIIERSFESGLRFQAVRNLGELNARARQWSQSFNADREHGRHGMTRYAAWMQITPEQLRIAPPREVCRALLTHAPQARKVNAFLQVDFQGRTYDVRSVPGVMVGERLHVAINPYEPGCATIVDRDADGHETLRSVPEVQRDAFGFPLTANVIGQEYRRAMVTRADENRAEVERVAMAAPTVQAAQVAREGKVLPFAGRIDPHKPGVMAKLPAFLPRRGTELSLRTRVIGFAREPAVLTHFEAARELARRGVDMNPACNDLVSRWYPSGVPESEVDALRTRLQRAASAGLHAVRGPGK